MLTYTINLVFNFYIIYSTKFSLLLLSWSHCCNSFLVSVRIENSRLYLFLFFYIYIYFIFLF